MAAAYDRFTAATEAAGLADWRRDLLADLSGVVVELGAGTGHNLRWYSSAVDRLVLTEPDPHMRARLEARVAEQRLTSDGPGQIEVLDRHGEALGLDDGSADAVVATLVLCSVPDPEAVLTEIQRVLRPGGRFAYLEHVAADDATRDLRWQRFFEPVWKRNASRFAREARAKVCVFPGEVRFLREPFDVVLRETLLRVSSSAREMMK